MRIQTRFAQRGLGLAQAALAGAAQIDVHRHYPRTDIVDARHGSQMYYHVHSSSRQPAEEHGHFHLFQRHADGAFSHLAGLSLDARGWPIRWFATNRWVTGERWQSASASSAAIERFCVACSGRLAPVAAWVSALVRLYLSELHQLCTTRDQVLQRVPQGQREPFFEDRAHDVLCEVPIDLPRRLHELAHA